MKKSTVFTVILIVCYSCNSYKFQAESMHWLQFRGPNASGIAPENADPPIHFNADTNLLWKTPIISGWSSPCVVNDRIFLNGFNDTDSMLYTMAFNRETGELQWQDSVKAKKYPNIHPINSYASKTIASDGKRIYSAFSRYGMISYDLNGNRIWEYKKPLDVSFYGGCSSPIIMDSVVLAVISNGKDKRLVALDCLEGDTVWAIREKDHEWANFNLKSTPLIWNDQVIMHFSWHLVSYNLFNKELSWWLDVPNFGPSTPVIYNDTLYVNS